MKAEEKYIQVNNESCVMKWAWIQVGENDYGRCEYLG